MTPGELFRSRRVSNNYSQQYVANYLNISRNAYSEWENDRTNITLKQCEQICELYEITLNELLEPYINKKQNRMLKKAV
jgi:transcriptional regulator with XRE-family HTH domain